MGINDDLNIDSAGLDFITKWEGCVLKVYKDVAGLKTIGVGHLITPEEDAKYPMGTTITREQAMALLQTDVQKCVLAIQQNVTVKLNQNQFNALCSFLFNVGTGWITKGSVLAAVNERRWNDVPSALAQFSKAKINGVKQVVPGLAARRKAEANLFLADSSVVPLIPWTKTALKAAQTRLKLIGLYTKSIDGVWGPGTEKAVRSFASSTGLDAGTDPKSGVPQPLYSALVETD